VSTLGSVFRELLGLFVDDGALALEIVTLVVLARMSTIRFQAPHWRCRWLDPPGACSTVIIRASLPGFSGRSLDMSDVTLGS
jgi:hypothetical protein